MRNKLVIERFNAGMITAASKEDTPLDAAVLSKDVDNASEEGLLRGRYGDSTFSTTVGKVAVSSAWITEDDDKRDLIHYNANAGQINSIRDFYGTPAQTTLQTQAAGIRPAMVGLGKSIRVGMGRTSALRPKWMGIIPEGRFGGEAPDGPQIADAELVIPGSTPFLEKVIAWWDGTDDTVIGFNEGEGTRLFKINLTTDAVTQSDADDDFVDIKAIADSNTAANMWVYALDSTYGTLYRVDKATLEINLTCALNAHTTPTGMYISDMVETDNKLWFAVYNPTANELGETCLYNIDTPTLDGNITLVNRSPRTTADGLTAGEWVNEAGTTPAAAPVTSTYKRSLIQYSGTSVGWLNDRTTSALLPSYVKTAASTSAIRALFNIVSETHNTGDVTDIGKFDDTTIGRRSWTGLISITDVPTIIYTSWDTGFARWTLADPDYTVGPNNMTFVYQVDSAPNQIAATARMNNASSARDEYLFGMRQNISPILYSTSWDGSKIAPFASEWEGGEIQLNITNGTPTTFTQNTTYFYRVSLMYDGFQSSPLSLSAQTSVNGAGVTNSKEIDVTIPDITLLSERVTAVQLWRASAANTTATVPTGFYRLVDTLLLTDPRWVLTGNVAVWTNYVDDDEAAGPSFEASTGLSETISSTMPHYELAVELNSYLFTARCYHPELPDASHIVFRSKPGRFDMFDWTTEIVRLPIVPTAIAAFGGRLFAFSETATYRINPEALVIEDVLEGVGALGPEGICMTEFGLVVANKTNVYLFGKNGVELIGEAIRAGSSGWSGLAHTYFNPVVSYVPEYQSIFIVTNSSSLSVVLWVYHVGKRRWDRWVLPNIAQPTRDDLAGLNGMVVGKLGECYYSDSAGLLRVAHSTQTRKLFEWTSRRFTLDGTMQYKKVYKAIPNKNSGTLTLTVDKNDAQTFSVTLASPYAFTSTDWRIQSMQFKMVSTAATTEVYAFDVIFRIMVGER